MGEKSLTGFFIMRHSYQKMSPQAALVEATLEEIDKTLSADFVVSNISELAPIGIDRILFLGFVQFSAYYVIDPCEGPLDSFTISLKDKEQQLTWPYQSLAQWIAIASVPREEITLFSLIDFKTRLTNWKIKADSSNVIHVPWSEVNLFKLKIYPWAVSEITRKKFKSLSWNPSFDQ